MAIRILCCSDNTDNYDICVNQKVAGFTTKGPETGDLIYLVVKYADYYYCNAKGILGEEIPKEASPFSENYAVIFNIERIDIMNPVCITDILKQIGEGWAGQLLIGSKPLDKVKYEKVTDSLSCLFECDYNLNKDEYINVDISIEALILNQLYSDDAGFEGQLNSFIVESDNQICIHVLLPSRAKVEDTHRAVFLNEATNKVILKLNQTLESGYLSDHSEPVLINQQGHHTELENVENLHIKFVAEWIVDFKVWDEDTCGIIEDIELNQLLITFRKHRRPSGLRYIGDGFSISG